MVPFVLFVYMYIGTIECWMLSAVVQVFCGMILRIVCKVASPAPPTSPDRDDNPCIGVCTKIEIEVPLCAPECCSALGRHQRQRSRILLLFFSTQSSLHKGGHISGRMPLLKASLITNPRVDGVVGE